MKNLARLFLLIILAVIAGNLIFSDFDLNPKKQVSVMASIAADS
ncbi:hypothetical protein [Bizionia myxarmorum]|nr:hypothetical protein [Bizionia myxarmorum]